MSLFANTTGYLLAAAVIAVVIAVLVVLYLKFRKGSLQIQLDQRSVQVGETISGTLCVVSKQDMPLIASPSPSLVPNTGRPRNGTTTRTTVKEE